MDMISVTESASNNRKRYRHIDPWVETESKEKKTPAIINIYWLKPCPSFERSCLTESTPPLYHRDSKLEKKRKEQLWYSRLLRSAFLSCSKYYLSEWAVTEARKSLLNPSTDQGSSDRPLLLLRRNQGLLLIVRFGSKQPGLLFQLRHDNKALKVIHQDAGA